MVGAMTIEHLLDRLTDGAVVITPGDRSDVLLGLLIGARRGLPVAGGYHPQRRVLPSQPIDAAARRPAAAAADHGDRARHVPDDARVGETRGRLTAGSQRKVDTARALFEQHVDGAALLAALDLPRPEVVTPLMFEYELIERARADRKHIVLPEGSDDRILRAATTLLARGVADLTILGDEAAIRARATRARPRPRGRRRRRPHDPDLRERFAQTTPSSARTRA